MSVNDKLGLRMKHNYEQITKYRLTRRTPVAIRLDGKAFHTFTKGFDKPFDEYFHAAMVQTMEYLLKNIQGAKFGYTQSDEITIILTDYDTLETDAWFDYEVQKLCSISASMATLAFNRIFENLVDAHCTSLDARDAQFGKYEYSLLEALKRGAMFDARCFNIPKEEVGNLIVWRWLDARRNSVQMIAQHYFSHKELQGAGNAQMRKMLEEKGYRWEDFPLRYRFGCICFKDAEGKWKTTPAYAEHSEMWKAVNLSIGYK